MPRRPRLPFWAQVFVGLALGVVLGFVARQFDQAWLAETLKTVGGIFVQLLKVIVVPLELTAIIVSIANLRQVTNAARLAGGHVLAGSIGGGTPVGAQVLVSVRPEHLQLRPTAGDGVRR